MQIKKLFLLTMLLGSSLVRAEVAETLNYTMYAVKPDAGSSLLKAINAATPIREGDKKYHGFTRWDVRWKYTYDTSSSGICRVKSVSVTLTTMITLPELNSNDETVVSQFASYLTALKKHEFGHLQIAQEAAKKIEQSLLRQPGLSNCEQLKTALNERGNALVAEAKTQGKEYDEQTQHGKTQGAYLKN